jgi:hypothetical protein
MRLQDGRHINSGVELTMVVITRGLGESLAPIPCEFGVRHSSDREGRIRHWRGPMRDPTRARHLGPRPEVPGTSSSAPGPGAAFRPYPRTGECLAPIPCEFGVRHSSDREGRIRHRRGPMRDPMSARHLGPRPTRARHLRPSDTFLGRQILVRTAREWIDSIGASLARASPDA